MKRPFVRAAALLLFASVVTTGYSQQAAAYRRFTTRDGKSFYAAVTGKNDLAVNLKLQNGQPTVLQIRELSQPDQQFVRKWTKFKDDLLNNAQFAKLTVREMLEMRGYQSFEFDIRGNHIFVEGELNGKPARFMVDTGADTSLLDTEAAKSAGVEMGPFDQVIRGIGGQAPAAVCKVPSIKLGDALIENRKILAADLFKSVGGQRDFQAIFGADFLRELDAVISYREGRMFLKPENLKLLAGAKQPPAAGAAQTPAAGYAEFKRWTTNDGKSFVAALTDKTDTQATFRMQNGQAAAWPIEKLSDSDKDVVAKWDKLRDILAKSPEWRTLTVKELLELRNYQSFAYRASGNHILVDGSVGAKKATFLIDTGAFSGVFHVPFAKEAGLEMGPMDQVIHGIGGTAPAALTKVPKLSMGDAVIENRTLLSADLYKDSGIPGGKGDHDAIFGADFLRELDGVISYKEARIFLRPDIDKADAPTVPPATPPATRPGIPSPTAPAPSGAKPATTTGAGR